MKRSLILGAMSMMICVAACGSSSSDPGSAAGPTGTDDANELKQKKLMLRIPLLEDSKNPKLLSTHKAELRAAGLGTFPDFVEIEGSRSGFATKASHKKWDDAEALVDKANEQLKLSLDMVDFGEPLNYVTKDLRTSICYTGNPGMAVNLIGSLTDSVFSDQLGIHGWRFKKAKHLDENLTPDDEKTFPKIWHDWRGDGDAILMITHTSDDGDEMDINIIPKCTQ